MQTRLAHLQFNVRPANLPFYTDLMACLGWDAIYGDEGMLGVGGLAGASLWFTAQATEVANDYDGPGLNHLALGADSIADVDAVAAYLATRGVTPRFATPRHRPEFASGPDQTYYQVMFETPDRILFEVVYTGPVPA